MLILQTESLTMMNAIFGGNFRVVLFKTIFAQAVSKILSFLYKTNFMRALRLKFFQQL